MVGVVSKIVGVHSKVVGVYRTSLLDNESKAFDSDGFK
jgi:hypothetical protein